ncbi:MAG TPA: hypothetical protein VFX30_04485 [bacterium]|nr:hypothetical protein [bacterium]
MKLASFKSVLSLLLCLAAHSAFAAVQSPWLNSVRSIPKIQMKDYTKVVEMKQWVVHLGGPHEERVSAVAQTDDNGYVILGSTTSFNAKETDVWLVRLDSDGGVVWQKKFGWSKDDFTGPMIRTQDNAFLMAGTTNSLSNDEGKDVWIAKADENGALLWKKILFVGAVEVGFRQLMELDNGDVILVGYATTDAGGMRAPMLVKINKDGAALWGRSYPKGVAPVGAGAPWRISLMPTSDGGQLLSAAAGVQDPEHGYGAGTRLVKLNPSGGVEWEKRYGGLRNDYSVGTVETPDQGYLILANSNSYGADIDDDHMTLTKVDYYGEVEWVKMLDSIPDPMDYQDEESAHAVYPTFNGMMVFGHKKNVIFLSLLKTDASVQWDRNYGMSDYDLNPAAALKTADSGWVMVATATPKGYGPGVDDDIVVIKVDNNGKLSPACEASDEVPYNPNAPMPVTDVGGANSPDLIIQGHVPTPTPMMNAPQDFLKDTISDVVKVCQ